MMKVNLCHANIYWDSIYKLMHFSSAKSELIKLLINLFLTVKKMTF